MCLACTTKIDQTQADAFADQLVSVMNHGALSLMISIGHRTGLFDAMASAEAFTSASLAESAGLNERYVREWLGAMTTGGIVHYEADTQTYRLPAEHAIWLSRASAKENIAVFAQYISVLGEVESQVVDCFREGGGVPYESFSRFHPVMAEDSGQSIVPIIAEAVLDLMPGIRERLEAGIDVLDIGCGAGRALNRLAQRFPNSRFYGYDISEQSISMARSEAERNEIRNISFEVRDLATMDEVDRFHLITGLDVIHDQAAPDVVLKNVHRALHPEGVFFMQDINASTHVDQNMDHPLGTLLYTVSTMHCMTVSLAQGGMGLGTMWGREKAEEMLQEAGFDAIDIHEFEHDIQNCYYVVRK